MTRAHPSVSDGNPQGQDAKRLDPSGRQRGLEGETLSLLSPPPAETSRGEIVGYIKNTDGPLPMPTREWLRRKVEADPDAETDASHPAVTETSRGEPVAWQFEEHGGTWQFCTKGEYERFKQDGWQVRALYTHSLPTVTEDYAGLIERIHEDAVRAYPDTIAAIEALLQKNKELEEEIADVLNVAGQFSPVPVTSRIQAIGTFISYINAAKYRCGEVEAALTASQAECERLRGEVELKDKALRAADQFITNGVALGFIRMPDEDCPDPAHETPKLIRAALSKKPAAEEGLANASCTLREQGKAYPRTCRVCGLGPCRKPAAEEEMGQ